MAPPVSESQIEPGVAPDPAGEAPVGPPSPAATQEPAVPSAPASEAPAPADPQPTAETTAPSEDEITSFVPDLDWNPLLEPGTNPRLGENHPEPHEAAHEHGHEEGKLGAAAFGPRYGNFKVKLVTVKLADKTLADVNAINLDAARASIAAADSYWRSASMGRLSITTVSEVRGFASRAKHTDSYDQIMATVTKELNWQYNPYEALVLFIPHRDLNSYGSWGILGGGFTDSATSGRVIMPYPSATTKNVVSHEFGHVLGLHHSNSLNCTNGRVDVARITGAQWGDPACRSWEYGDTLDIMGFAQLHTPMINSFMYEFGGFGRGDEIRNAGIASGSKQYTLKAWAGGEANRAVKFTDPGSGEVYYIELRLPVGRDASSAVGGNRGVKIIKKDHLGWNGNASVVLTPNSRWVGYYNENHTWQAGSIFTTHRGTRVHINSIGTTSASITITALTSTVAPAPAPVVLDKTLAAVNAGDFNRNGTHDLVSRRPDGTLWFHDGSGTGSFRAPVKIGSGWGIYSQLIGGQDFNADGRPDLIGRKTDGTLWFYAGTGAVSSTSQGYKPAAKVGSGWNIYDIMVSPGDFTGDRRADLIARKPDGTLWLYRGTGTSPALLSAPVRIGTGGWTAFNLLSGAGDYTGDGRADLLARKPDGGLWLYQGTGNVSTTSTGYLPGRKIASGWAGYTDIVGASDFNRDGKTDLVGFKADMSLWFFAGTAMKDDGYRPGTRIASTGWQGYNTVVGPGDFNASGTKDVIARRTDGSLWFYNGNGRGGYGTPIRIGSSGWNAFIDVLAPGDLNGDRRPDLLARHRDGSLWFYAGTGTVSSTSEGYKPGRKIGAGGWLGFSQLMAPGDYNGDGRPDLLGRKTDGTLWFWAGTGTISATSEGYSTAVQIGRSGWQGFNHVITPGDFTGDKRNDLLARKPDGSLWLYAGTGAASTTQEGYKPAVRIGTTVWSTFTTITGPGDFNGDTKADLLATRPDGSLWFYAGTHGTNAGYNPAKPAGKL
ncbi:FG-GAP-like repeat-containing protein [Arthrobacter zhaoguopingii]|uniref:FG-GAP-like repeat-containing protein n=1 Tax=Arthrobacter zhaoguopingii TaxID=2681491 RepID=UPI00135C2D0A|nr:FG-GAP-like repeat-containing protein [Arthrobacter zhaoguopingii]